MIKENKEKEIICWACGETFLVNSSGWVHCPYCGAVVANVEEEEK